MSSLFTMTNKHKIFSRLLVLIMFLLSGPVPVATADETVQVAEVIDGDTILLKDGRRVRYLGVNTPEINEPLHQQAKKLNASLVSGRKVRLEFDREKTDSYGRLLAYVYVGNEMVNARLIRDGLAHALFIEGRGGSRGRHDELILRSQAEARQRKVGMWSGQGFGKKLKITSVHPAESGGNAPQGSLVRVASLADSAMRIGGYILSDKKGHQYTFPDVSIEPGHTVLISGRQGRDGRDGVGRLIVHWPSQDNVWRSEGGTAYLMGPAGAIVDTFPYGEQLRNSSPRNPAREGKVIGNRTSKIYHVPGQSSYDRIREENRVYFNSETEAGKAGYRRAHR